jgi:hypothetical protein
MPAKTGLIPTTNVRVGAVAMRSANPNHRSAENASIRQEAFLVDARNRITKYVVAARQTARRASTVSKLAFSTVMDHRPGRSATKATLGGTMNPLGMRLRQPSQNSDCDHRS